MSAWTASTVGQVLTPDDIETLKRVEALNREGNSREAYRLLSPLLIAHPDLFITNYLMGLLLQNTGNGVLAVRYYRTALSSQAAANAPGDNTLNVLRDTYQRLFDIYTRTLFLGEAEKLITSAGELLETSSRDEMKANLEKNKANLDKILRPAPLEISNDICTISLPLPEGWVWMQWPDRDEQYEALHRGILKNGALDVRSVLTRTLKYDEGVVTPSDREVFANSMMTTFASQLREQDNRVEGLEDTVVAEHEALTLRSSKMSGFVKLYDITTLIPLDEGLVFMVIPHRSKKTAEMIFNHCQKALKIK